MARVGAVEAGLALFRIDSNPRYFDWQRDAVGFYDAHFMLYAAAGVLYLPLTFLGKRYFRDRKAAPVPTWLLCAWNGFWAVFSGLCFYDIGRLMFASQLSWHTSICTDEDTADSVGELAQFALRARFLFIIAKLAELGDTAFIVLKKRPLIVLHYWHHETVMLFCWNIAYLRPDGGDGTYFGLMNAFVHAVMYGYYALSVVFKGIRRVPGLPLTITLLQIAQMMVGIGLLAYRTRFCVATHTRTLQNLAFGWLIYATYLVLFVNYFVQRYAFGAKKEKAHATRLNTREHSNGNGIGTKTKKAA